MSRRRRIGSGAGGAWWSANTLLVVLSGMPFELSSRVLAVMIDGEWVYRE